MSSSAFEAGAWLEGADGLRFPVGRTCSIGRSRGNQLVLADIRVSRRHAVIQMQMVGEYWIVDFGTVNGTRVDGKRIALPTLLRDGAKVEVGGQGWVFRQPATGLMNLPHETVSTTATMHDLRRMPVWLLVTDIVDSTHYFKMVPTDKLPQLVGQWFSRCRELMDGGGGYINQYLGDGFLGHWADGEGVEGRVEGAVKGLVKMQQAGSPDFRWVLHFGEVLAGGVMSPGEETLMGPDMHFVFRMEGVAKQLGRRVLVSEPAAQRIGVRLPLVEVGRLAVKGFETEKLFFTLAG
jgi:adenylate cyclase